VKVIRSILALVLIASALIPIIQTYNVKAAADIAIMTDVATTLQNQQNRGGVYWTTPLIGYVISADGDGVSPAVAVVTAMLLGIIGVLGIMFFKP
jgi:hypothetical protein